MGRNKNRHTKDRLFISVTEHREEWGGKKDEVKPEFKRLGFNCCALSLTPFTNPVCTRAGTVFDLLHIVPYLQKHKKNPVTGEELAVKDLVKLTFHTNPQGEYHCPITYRVFTNSSKIVANSRSGHVYSWEAVDELCKKSNSWKDLLTGEPFTQEDLIVLQDPADLRTRNILSFYHIQTETPAERERDAAPETASDGPKSDKFTTGLTAASFTSTKLDPQPKNTYRGLSEAEIRQMVYKELKSQDAKGYVQIVTTHGPLNFELYCSQAPMTCENFLTLCEEGYYNEAPFHRSIPGFVLQGGDPTGTGRGGKHIFGGDYFRDECNPQLRHVKRGIVSMANSGPNTNRSQFFVCYQPSPHLDMKHTVFGEVIGGMETLTLIENLPTDASDRFKNVTVAILTTQVLVNPFKDTKEAVLSQLHEEQTAPPPSWLDTTETVPPPGAIGRYISKRPRDLPSGLYADYASKKRPRTTFDFTNW